MASVFNSLDQAKTLRRLSGLPGREAALARTDSAHAFPTRVISVTSGKGGVGKTAVVANIAVSMAKLGKKVLIIDADLGLANIDVVYGLTPQYNLNHFFNGHVGLNEILVEGPGGVKILPAGSGLQQVTHLNALQKVQFMEGLDGLREVYDVVLIDTEAGISENVTYFNAAAQEVLVVATSDPASITDAYTLMKLLSIQFKQKNFQLVVNIVKDAGEGLDVFQKLTLVANRFLDISINYLGCIPYDKRMRESLRRQRPIVELYPDGKVTEAFESLTQGLLNLPLDLRLKGSLQFFWKSFLAISQAEGM
ncbi:MAG: MinD/ParA family protein [Deltaproteobacteria bacterium]|nr:MinD/ParA family protein [Deltaproteobacteria bacterium]